MTISHLCTDEKFFGTGFFLFEKAFPLSNRYWVFVKKSQNELKHVDQCESTYKIQSNNITEEHLLELSKSDLIVCHGLDYNRAKVVEFALNKNIPVLWLFWGGEIFNNPITQLSKNTLGPKTIKKFPSSISLNYYLKQVYYPLLGKGKPRDHYILDIAKRIPFFGNLIQEDYDILNEAGYTNAKRIDFCYCPIEYTFKSVGDLRVNGNDILFGNSATKENNHLEVFNIINKRTQKEQTIITPLSYGDHNYLEFIINEGHKILGDKFEPWTDFLPLNEYNKKLRKCGFVVMNHYRQQAVGNTLLMVWMGAKVFLSFKSPVFHYLKRIGIHVFSIEDDLENNSNSLITPLSLDQQNNNRAKLVEHISTSVVVRRLKQQIEELFPFENNNL